MRFLTTSKRTIFQPSLVPQRRATSLPLAKISL
nr:MAG TPA: hypothetical protein [Caudoviricetes sp.]